MKLTYFLVTLISAILIGVTQAAVPKTQLTYKEHLRQNLVSIKSEDLDFCKGSPVLDENYYYCGFY